MIVPPNDVKVYVGDKNSNGMTRAEFDRVIDSVEKVYAPIVKGLGGDLQIERNWDDPTVNAYAQRKGNIWKVAMFGGLARHHTITPDAFAAVVCHEIGHHMGGMPRYMNNKSVMSTEGQADYWAMTKCLRRVWKNDNNVVKAPELVKQQCNTHNDVNSYNICLRSSLAGQSLANLFAVLRKVPVPQFNTRNTAVAHQIRTKQDMINSQFTEATLQQSRITLPSACN